MLYNDETKQSALDALHDRVSSVVDISIALLSEGYIPNKNKAIKLQWSLVLIDAFENIDVLSVEQHTKLENLYSKVMGL